MVTDTFPRCKEKSSLKSCIKYSLSGRSGRERIRWWTTKEKKRRTNFRCKEFIIIREKMCVYINILHIHLQSPTHMHTEDQGCIHRQVKQTDPNWSDMKSVTFLPTARFHSAWISNFRDSFHLQFISCLQFPLQKPQLKYLLLLWISKCFV